MLLKPAEIAKAIVATGESNVKQSPMQTTLLGVAAGIFIGLGGVASLIMYTTVADAGLGKFLGSTLFVIAIMFTVLSGGALFTGNHLMTLGLIEKKYKITAVLKNWGLVFLGNFIGAAAIALLTYYSGILGNASEINAIGEKAVSIATAKLHIPFFEALIRGILCNLLVAGAVWMQTASDDVTGKIFAMYFPIVAFVVSGYEHVVANMFYIPMGLLLARDLSCVDMLVNNFIPVAIGNTIGGGVIIPVIYYLIYVKKQNK